jgi:hypothetical protein
VCEDVKEIVGGTLGILFIFIGIHVELQTFIPIPACATTVQFIFPFCCYFCEF